MRKNRIGLIVSSLSKELQDNNEWFKITEEPIIKSE